MYEPHHLFDHEERWRERNHPSPTDLSYWNQRLTRLAGRDSSGLSKVRVVWGMDFDSTRMLVCGQWVMRYAAYRWEDGPGLRDVGRPRFIVEELHPRAELNASGAWEAARYEWRGLERVDVLGPMPEHGYYSELFTVAHHDGYCCGGRGVKDAEPCHGGYREPNEADIQRVAAMVARRNAAPESEAIPSAERLRREGEARAEKAAEKRRQMIREVIDNALAPQAHKFFTLDESIIRNGKYHWLRGHSKSGLTPEERVRVLRGESPITQEQNASSATD